MKIFDVVQKSDEWHQFRAGGIGASTVSTLIPRGSKWDFCKSPYESPYGSYLSRKGLKKFSAEALEIMEKGVVFEDYARELYEKSTGKTLLPLCAAHDEFDFIRVSFDGLDIGDNIPREIKVPFNKFFFLRIKKEHQSSGGDIFKCKYYQYYIPQVQMQMFVADSPYGELLVYKPKDPDDENDREELIVFHVKRDEEMIQDLLGYIKDYWYNCIIADKPPALDPELDFLNFSSDIENDVIALYQEKLKLKKLEDEAKVLKESIKEKSESIIQKMNGYPKGKGFGISIEEKYRKGTIDYSKAIETLMSGNIDYRGAVEAFLRNKTQQEVDAFLNGFIKTPKEVEEFLESFRKKSSRYFDTDFLQDEMGSINVSDQQDFI
jgi:putative phage-type endonuclease